MGALEVEEEACFRTFDFESRFVDFEVDHRFRSSEVFVNVHFPEPDARLKSVLHDRLYRVFRDDFSSGDLFPDDGRDWEFLPSKYDLVVGLVEYWKSLVMPTLGDADYEAMAGREVLPRDLEEQVIVTLPQCENWIVDQRFLELEQTETREKRNDRRPWSTELKIQLLKRCARPYAVRMSCILRNYLKRYSHIEDYLWKTNRIPIADTHIRYIRTHLPFRIQYCLYFASHEHREFLHFVSRVWREIRTFGEDSENLVIRLGCSFAMAPKGVYLYYQENLNYDMYAIAF